MKIKTPVLISGASGFVGANFLRRLIKEVAPKRVHVILRKNSNTWRINEILKKTSVHITNLGSRSQADKLLQTIRPRTIFHLATHGAYPYQQQDEKEIINTNIICTFNLIQACLKTDFDAFINTGTSSEYGINMKPMNEKDKLMPVTAYGASKAWATQYCQYLAAARKVPITTLRLFGVYGFYEPRGRLIPNIILSLLKNEQPTLIATNLMRDFIFVEDVVDAYFKALRNNSPGLIYNVGSGRQIPLKQVFDTLRDIMGVDIEPKIENNMTDLIDTNQRIADITSAKKYLGWKPKVNLAEGLEQTVDWFKKKLSSYE